MFSGLHVSRAGLITATTMTIARQVTVFGVLATPNAKTVDSRLSNIQSQLDKLLPKNGFKLLDARSERIVDGESITCSLGHGYKLTTLLVKPLDENGKVELRCELFRDKVSEFSTLVKTPLDQLFFCQRALSDGSQLLIGVGRTLSVENNRPPSGGRQASKAVHHAEGRSLAASGFRRLRCQQGRPSLRPSTKHQAVRQSLRRVDLIVKANRPSLALGPQAASPSLDATAVSRPLPSVVPDRFGFPTDMGCIGHAAAPSATFLAIRMPSRNKCALNVQSAPNAT